MATINGNESANTLTGGTAADTINGLGGNDTLIGNAGDDTLDGGTGNDRLLGGRGSDTYRFGQGYGFDVIDNSGGASNDVDTLRLTNLNANQIRLTRIGNDLVLTVLATGETITVSQCFLDADHAIDRIQFADGSRWGVSEALANLYYPPVVPTNGADVINGNPTDDTLLGLGGNDTLYGNSGNDTLDGGIGNDRMEGGVGNDVYVVDAAGDVVVEASNAGDDLVQASISYTLGSNVERLTLTGTANINGTGNALANTLIGNAGNNQLDGGAGNDLIQGGDGNDTLQGGAGNDSLNGDAGNDLLDGGAGNDSMAGGSGDDIYIVDQSGDSVSELAGGGNDTVRASLNYSLGANLENLELTGSANINGTGNALANRLTGNTGNNLLNGGAGDDVLAGRRGNDTYVYGTNYGNDVIDNSGGASADVDTVQLVGLNSGNVRFVHNGNDLQMVVLATSQTLTLKNFYLGADYEIDRVRFDNNVVWNTATLKAAATLPVNAAPSSTNDSQTTLEDTPVTLGSADFGTYSDPENTPLAAVKITSLPVLGSLQYNNGSAWVAVVQDQVISKADLDAGKLQFVPALNGNGSNYVSIGFKVGDGTAFAVNANTLSVNVTPVNDAPTVSSPVSLANGVEDTPYTFTTAQLLAHASDVDAGTTLSVLSVSVDSGLGALTNNGNGSWTFTPVSNLNGPVNFAVVVSDGSLQVSTSAQLNLAAVNDAPVVNGVSGTEGSENGFISANVSTSVQDPDGDSLTYTFAPQSTLGGSVAGFAESPGAFFYSANSPAIDSLGAGAQSVDVISYSVQDGHGGSANGTYEVHLTGVNDAPIVATALLAQNANQDSPFSYTVPLDTFADVDVGDTLGYSASLANGDPLPSWLSFDSVSRSFSGTPGNGDVGSLSVKVTATDGSNATASSSFNLNVGNSNDAPVVSAPSALPSGTEDTAYNITAAQLLANASDPDGDTLSVADLSANHGTLFDNGDGSWTFTPDANYNGAVTLNYQVIDGQGGSAAATQGFNLVAVNDAPTVATALLAQNANQDLPFSYTVPLDTFADVDVGDTLGYSASLANGDPLPSWLSFDSVSRSFSGTPGNGDVGSLSVRVTATDGSNATASSSFTLTIGNTNDAPVVSAPSMLPSGTEDTAYSITSAQLLANASDPDGDTLSVTNLSANHGTLVDNGDGSWTFTPDANYNGAVTLNYQVIDGHGGSAPATQGFNLVAVNDAPTLQVALFDQTSGLGQPAAYTLPANAFADVDVGDSLVLSARLANGDPLPTWLTFDAPSRSFSGTPPAGTQPGGIGITVTATDSGGLSASDDFTFNLVSSLVGTPDDDLLIGSPFDDAIYGLAGNDTLVGGTGNDMIDGGSGDDRMSAGDGSDTLQGGDGNDLLRDIDGTGQVANNSIDAGAGNDTIQVSQSNVNSVTRVIGGSGRDTYQFQPNSIGQLLVSDFGPGATGDILDINDLLTNSSGYSGGNPFAPALGYLRLVQQGADTLLQWDRDGAGVATNGWQTVITLQNTNAAELTIENFTPAVSPDGSLSGLTLNGTPNDDVLNGSMFNDTINGLAGNDTLNGFNGNDVLVGGSGDDTLSGGTGNDWLMGGSGSNVIIGGDGNDTLEDGDASGLVAINSIDGGAGNDQIIVSQINPDSITTVIGGSGRDTYFPVPGSIGQLLVSDFTPGSAGDILYINNLLIGSSYSGGNPFDPAMGFLRLVQQGADTLLQWDRDGAGVATNSWQTVITLQNTNAATLTSDNFSPATSPAGGVINLIEGGAGDDLLTGTASADRLLGHDGNDTLVGLAGNDELDGGVGNDRLDGGAGIDSVRYSASINQYIFTVDPHGDLVVEAGAGSGVAGLDQINAVEQLSFADGTIMVNDSLGGEVQVNTNTTGDQLSPSVAALAGGGYVVSWVSYSQDGSGNGIYAQIFDASGAAVTGEVRVNSSTFDNQEQPAIGALGDGGYVVTWMSNGQDGNGYGIYAQRYDVGGTAVGSEVRVNSTTLGSQEQPVISGLSDGGYVVSWMSSGQDGSGYGIYAQRYDASGTAVGSEVRVNSTTPGSQEQPAISGLSDGGYVVSWMSNGQDGSGFGIYSQRYDSGGVAVGGEVRVNTVTLNNQSYPSVTALAGGGYVVIWFSQEQDGSSFGIYSQRYDASGAAVGGEARVSSSTLDSYQQQPVIDALSDGGYVVSWTYDEDGSGYGICARRFDANGAAVGGEVRVNTENGNGQLTPSVAALAGGGYVVSWTSEQDGSGWGIYAQRFDASGHAVINMATLTGDASNNLVQLGSGDERIFGGAGNDTLFGGSGHDTAMYLGSQHDFAIGVQGLGQISVADLNTVDGNEGIDTLHDFETLQFSDGVRLQALRVDVRVNSTTFDQQQDPAIAVLGDGGYAVSWASYGQDGSGYGVYLQRYDALGAAVGGEVRVNSTTLDDQLAPVISTLSDGGYVVSWMSGGQDGNDYDVYAQRYDASGGAVGGEVRVNSTTLDSQQDPTIAALSDGGYVVSWVSIGQDGSGYGIYAQRYDASGAAVGGEVQVNSTTLDNQLGPVISGLSGGGYVVSWMSSNQDGNGYGVYAQHYDASGAVVGGEVQVNSTTLDNQMAPAISGLSDGGYVISWASSNRQNDTTFYAQRYDASGSAVGGEVLLNNTSSHHEQQPAIAALSDGGYVVSWMSDVNGSGIQFQRYDANGLAVGGEVQIDSSTSHQALRPVIGAFSDDGFVVSWMSVDQDDSGFNIYTQRYDSNGNPVLDHLEWTGDASANVIRSTLETDWFSGGTGADTFQFAQLPGDRADLITDFTQGSDVLALNSGLFNLQGQTVADTLANVNGAQNEVAGAHLVFNQNDHTLYYDADGAANGNAVAVVTLTGVTTLTASDVHLYV
ncbi:hypothetical protein AEQ67_21840 [Pseudomonas sp. RIT-PI-q]|uniref:cadherin-like domain-containing protein n=1 Tax=Pseudomonas sp. RIT-PI-q TaxID=1690247 RepID=UPI0006CD3F38|nr:cadherin-like domain-containing protein [Pseudomonas sp. RIT-PI-q]KPG94797.1 hypothetical protein AEQ67_21840 [Pseudomonas sp. RIT-PI-q]